jgi:hypothetical protein
LHNLALLLLVLLWILGLLAFVFLRDMVVPRASTPLVGNPLNEKEIFLFMPLVGTFFYTLLAPVAGYPGGERMRRYYSLRLPRDDRRVVYSMFRWLIVSMLAAVAVLMVSLTASFMGLQVEWVGIFLPIAGTLIFLPIVCHLPVLSRRNKRESFLDNGASQPVRPKKWSFNEYWLQPTKDYNPPSDSTIKLQ